MQHAVSSGGLTWQNRISARRWDIITAVSHRESTVRGWELGTRLRELRERARISGHEAGARVGISVSTISRIDTGKRVPTPEETASLLTVYGVVGDERTDLLALAHEAPNRDFWNRYGSTTALKAGTLAALEARARTITCFEMNWIPGLVQTGAYTTALMRASRVVAEGEVEARVHKRLTRQHVVLRRNNPVRLDVIIDESALHRKIGSSAVMHRQLDYLLIAGQRPNVRIRIIPAEIGVPAGQFPFVLLTFPVAPRTVVFLENLSSSMFLETPDDTAVYERAVELMSDVALSVADSAELIAGIKTGLEADPDVLPHIP